MEGHVTVTHLKGNQSDKMPLSSRYEHTIADVTVPYLIKLGNKIAGYKPDLVLMKTKDQLLEVAD